MGPGVRIAATERPLLDALASTADPAQAWRAYRAANAELLDYYAGLFGGPDRSDDELAADLAGQSAALRRRERALALELLAPRVAELLQVPSHSAIEAVTFVGWGRAIAWCDDEADDPRAYFALERLPESSPLCRSVGAHELAHLAHFRVRRGAWPPWSVLTGIVAEAVAVATAHLVVPDADPTAALLLQPGALEAYERHRGAVHAELLSLLDVVDEPTYRRVMFPPLLCEGGVAGVNETGYAVALALTEAWRGAGLSPAQAARRTPAQARADLVALLSS